MPDLSALAGAAALPPPTPHPAAAFSGPHGDMIPAIIPDTLNDAIEAAETGPLGTRPGLTRIFRFAVIGSAGFVWDTATTYATKGLIGLLPAALLAFVVAASLNWIANRAWTFRDRNCEGPLARQWLLYMAANSLGFLLNRGTFTVLVLSFATCRAHPVIALAAGAVAGLGANFGLAHKVVFRH